MLTLFPFSRPKNARGFTLIELLVVIAIIGILASIVLASLNTARRKSRDARRIADIKQIQLALELFADGNAQEYPDDIYAATNALFPNFIPAVPTDPTGGNYNYDNLDSAGAACAIATGNCTLYHLGANLEEGTNPALDGDADACTAVGTGCSRALPGTTLSGRDDGGAFGNDCVGTGTAVFCYDATP